MKFIWDFIKQTPYLPLVFPRLLRIPASRRKYMWMVLSSLEDEVACDMVHNTRLNRKLDKKRQKCADRNLEEIYDKLLSLPPHKK